MNLRTLALTGAVALALTASAATAQERLIMLDGVIGDAVSYDPSPVVTTRWQYGIVMPYPHAGLCRYALPPCAIKTRGDWR